MDSVGKHTFPVAHTVRYLLCFLSLTWVGAQTSQASRLAIGTILVIGMN